MMADGYNAKRRGEQFQNSPSYSGLSTTKIDVGNNLPVENAINDQCHAFFFNEVYRP